MVTQFVIINMIFSVLTHGNSGDQRKGATIDFIRRRMRRLLWFSNLFFVWRGPGFSSARIMRIKKNKKIYYISVEIDMEMDTSLVL